MGSATSSERQPSLVDNLSDKHQSPVDGNITANGAGKGLSFRPSIVCLYLLLSGPTTPTGAQAGFSEYGI